MPNESGILTDTAIRAAVRFGDIQIDPYDPAHVNPASYDLTLGDDVAVYKDWVDYQEPFGLKGSPPIKESYHECLQGWSLYPREWVIDIQQEPKILRFKMDPEKGWILKPGIGYLMCTRETVGTTKYVSFLDGKSSVGRLFIKVHETAGYIDPGFVGQVTLEVTAQHPIRVYPGMRICQIRFQDLHGRVGKTYDKVGHYTGEAAKGAVGSQAWKQFQK